MLRNLFATTAVASLLALGAYAQETHEQMATPGAEAPGTVDPAPADAMPDIPNADTAQGQTTPASPAVPDATGDTEMAPMPPATDTAEEPAMAPEEATETAEQPSAAPDTGMMADTNPALSSVAAGEISADKLIGATIQNTNGEDIASVEDVLVSPEGTVENVVATFGGFLGFGTNTVLLAIDEVEVMQDESGNLVVQTALTPEDLEGRPDYEPAE